MKTTWIVYRKSKIDNESSIQKAFKSEAEALRYIKYIPNVLKLDSTYSYREIKGGS